MPQLLAVWPPWPPPPNPFTARHHPLTHLESVHQFQGLAVILISLEDDICQLVDDDVQGALLLNWPAEVQLQGGNTEELQCLSAHLGP